MFHILFPDSVAILAQILCLIGLLDLGAMDAAALAEIAALDAAMESGLAEIPDEEVVEPPKKVPRFGASIAQSSKD